MTATRGPSFLVLISATALAVTIVGCGNIGGLSADSSCADWNDATLNQRGTYVVSQEKAGVPNLNRWTGFAQGEISRYCANDPTMKLGNATTKVSTEYNH